MPFQSLLDQIARLEDERARTAKTTWRDLDLMLKNIDAGGVDKRQAEIGDEIQRLRTLASNPGTTTASSENISPKIALDEELRRGALALSALGDEEGWVPAFIDMLKGAGPEIAKDAKGALSGAMSGAKQVIQENTGLDELYKSLFVGSGKPSGLRITNKPTPASVVPEPAYGPALTKNGIDLAKILAEAHGETPFFQMGSQDVAKNSRGSVSKTSKNGRDWSAINDEMQRIRLNSRPTISAKGLEPGKKQEMESELTKAQMYSAAQAEGKDREGLATMKAATDLVGNDALPIDRMLLGLSILNRASGGRLNLDEITQGLYDTKAKSSEAKAKSGEGYGGLGAGLGTVAGIAAAPYLGIPTLLAGLLGLGIGTGTGVYLSPDE